MNNRDEIILKKVLDEINVIEEIISGYDQSSFLESEKTKRAACMTLINIGELVKSITDQFRKQYSGVPWREISGMRDIAAHKYQTLKMERVWNTVKKDIPLLKTQIEKMIWIQIYPKIVFTRLAVVEWSYLPGSRANSIKNLK